MASPHAILLRHITLRAAASVPDAVLLHRFVVSRDEDAFAGLVRRHGAVVYRVCHGLLGPSAAEDAFQATFLVLATRAATVRKAGSVGSWLVGVAGRVARQMRKARCRRDSHETAAAKATASEWRSEPNRVEVAERSRILDEELTGLPDRLRDPVVACLLQGRTYEQAAAELGGSARTVRRRLDEAKKVLRVRLERRGVMPAVAAGLVAGVGAAGAAVPAGLGWRTAATVSDFLAGGATALPAVIAQGVATTMTTTVWKATTLMAAAVGLTALGVGLAGDGGQVMPPAAQPPTASRPIVAPPATPAVNPAPADFAFPLSTAAAPAPRVPPRTWPGDSPSPGAVRAVASEAEFLRKAIAKRWFGDEWRPGDQWKLEVLGAARDAVMPPIHVNQFRIIYWRGVPTVAKCECWTEAGQFRGAAIDLAGPLDEVIDNQLPRTMTRAVMAESFGRSLPWWADVGVPLLAESEAKQAQTDSQCRAALTQGRGIRLAAVFTLAQAPAEAEAAAAQAHSVVRFLLGRKSRLMGVFAGGFRSLRGFRGAYDGTAQGTRSDGRTLYFPKTTALPASPEGVFLTFLGHGMEHGWDKAVRDVYDFENVAALEEAWLQWMKTGESQLARPIPPRPSAKPASADPPLIPPVKLSGGQ